MEINEDILIRYIDGMLTEEEAVEVKNWRAASLENEKLLEQVAGLFYSSSGKSPKSHADREPGRGVVSF